MSARSWTSIATAGSICTSATTCSYSLDGAHRLLRARRARRDYCRPNSYGAQPDRLYRNQRDGTFADVTRERAWRGEFGPALGVATADFNGDGWIDIYVANDGEENQLWINQRDGTFKNTALAGRRGADR